MPLERDAVQHRTTGVVQLGGETMVLGLSAQAVLAVSCFAVAAGWSPSRLAAGTRYAHYHTIAAGRVGELGFELWPTATSTNGAPDPRNPVHFDIVVVRGLDLAEIAPRTGQPAERRRLRRRFLPAFAPLLDALDGPVALHPEDGEYAGQGGDGR